MGWGPDAPFAPRQLPFFYGWVVLVVATLGILASIPGQTMGVSVFTDSILEATGLSRLQVSNAYLVGTILSGLSLPWAGVRMDRLGARVSGFGAALGLGCMLIFLSEVDRISSLLGDTTEGTLFLLIVGFLGIRFFGQGTLTMVSRTMLGRWFERRRGLAAGISGVVTGFGFGVAPRVLDGWIQEATWRGAWQQLAVLVAVGMGSIVLIFFRNDPESCGLRMDGRAPTILEQKPEERAYTRRDAIRTLAFWAVTATLACHSMIVTGITFHIVDLGAEVGVGRSEAVSIFLPMAVTSTAVGLIGGVLADRIPVRALLASMALAEAVGVVGAVDLSSRSELAVLGLGVGAGLFLPVSTIAYPQFFGRRNLGAIVGVEMMLLVVASALGPSLLASSRDAFGSYAPALYLSLVLPAFALVLSMVFRRPK